MIRRMRRTTRHRLMTLAAVVTLTGGAAATWAVADSGPELPARNIEAIPADVEPPPEQAGDVEESDPRDTLVLDPAKFELVDDHYVQKLEDGRIVHLTLVPELQKSAKQQFDRRGKEVPHG